MATRMQQRRGTAAQWVSSNSGAGPILNAGEIGWESDTNKFKIGDGASSWTSLTYFVDATDVIASSLGGYVEIADIGAISGVAGLDASKNLIVPGASIIVEGATDDAYETTLIVTEPSADRTITFPNATGTVVVADTSGNVTVSGDLTVNGTTTTINSTTINATTGLVFEGTTGNDFETTISVTDPTADRAITFPDSTGTVAMVAQLNNYVLTSAKGVANGVASLDGGGQVPLAQTHADVALTSQITTHANLTEAHGATGAVVGTTNTQTLTNKTLTSPKINEDVAVTATATELNVLDGITSSTAELNILDGATLTVTELNYVDGVTSAIQNQIDAKAPLASPTFTGTVTLPSGTVSSAMIIDGTIVAGDIADGAVTSAKILDDTIVNADINTSAAIDWTKLGISSTVSSTEIGYVDGVTSAIQTQLDDKLSKTGGTMTGALTLSGAPTVDLHAATKAYVDNVVSGLNFHQPVRVATTANITLSGEQTIDGVAVVAGDRVLVKDQTTQTQNGIYVAAAGAWSRALDADNTPDGEIKGGDFTLVIEGTVGSGYGYVCSNTSTITIGTTDVTYAPFNAAKGITAGSGLTESSPGTLAIDTGGVTSTMIANDTIVNADINSGAAIDWTKLAISSTVSSTEIGYVDGVTSAIQTQLDAKTPELYTFVTDATTSRTLALGDKFASLRFTSASATTVTVPTNSAVAFPIGSYVELYAFGSGQITVTQSAGVTVNATDAQKKSRVQYSSMTLIKIATDEWLLVGDTAA